MSDEQTRIAENQYPDDSLPKQPHDGTTGKGQWETISDIASQIENHAADLRSLAEDVEHRDSETNVYMSHVLRLRRHEDSIISLANQLIALRPRNARGML